MGIFIWKITVKDTAAAAAVLSAVAASEQINLASAGTWSGKPKVAAVLSASFHFGYTSNTFPSQQIAGPEREREGQGERR